MLHGVKSEISLDTGLKNLEQERSWCLKKLLRPPLIKTWMNFSWIDDCSRTLNMSRIRKLPDPVSSETSDLYGISDLFLFVVDFASQNKKKN